MIIALLINLSFRVIPMRQSLLLGYLALTISQIGISLNVVTSKFLLATMPMFAILAGRFLISTILLGLLLRLTKTPLRDPQHPQHQLTRQDWFLAISQGLTAAFLFNLFFVWGLQHTTATAAGIVSSTLPAIIALCAVWMLNERLNNQKIAALFLSMLGILIINLDHMEGSHNLHHSYLGDFLVFVAMFPEACYSIVGRKLAGRVTPLGTAFISNLVGFVTLFPCAIVSSSLDLTTYGWSEAIAILIAAISSLIFFWGWSWGISFIPASTAAIFGGIMPIATTLFAILFLSEHLQWYDMVGMILVILSIVVGTGRKRRKKAVASSKFGSIPE